MPVAAPPVDAYAIFVRTRSAVTAARYPSRLDYTIAIAGLNGDKPENNRYRASANVVTGEVDVEPMSEEELAAPPPVPHGVNASMNAVICMGMCWAIKVPVGRPVMPFDLLGIPLLEPTYMFGLSYPGYQHGPQRTIDAPLPTIAVVATNHRDYAVELLDEPNIDGISTYHLKLTPLRKPKDNRLRELWVGQDDDLPRRAVVSGNFTQAPLVDVPWTIDFAVTSGVPFVARETAGATLYLSHRRVVRGATIAFDNVRPRDGNIFGEPLVSPPNDDTALVEP